jgi:phage head maturation protease
MTRIRIQGYALPWDKPAYVDDLEETVAPGAVSAEPVRNVALLVGDHVDVGRRVYANTRTFRRNLTLFVDAYGLGFNAWLDDEQAPDRGVAEALRNGSVTQCSVNFINMSRQATGRIVHAQIDHIALVEEGAYADTGCWLADQPWNALQPWLRDMRRTFALSTIERTMASTHAPSSAEREAGRAPAASARGGTVQHAGASPRPLPNSLRALMNSALWDDCMRNAHDAARIMAQ